MTQNPQRAIGFDPAIDANTRVLVLGSLPGVASLAVGQYYAHPRNAFWRIMEALTHQPLSQQPYAQRLSNLNRSGIGLWDVLASAQRAGSLDAAIRSEEAADLLGLIKTLPNLKAIAFNGAKSAKVGLKILSGNVGETALLTLPSSSPAHARPLGEKVEQWGVLRPFLDHIS